MSTMPDFKLDTKVGQLSRNMAGALNAVENRLGERTTAEEERRHKEVAGRNMRTGDVMKRIEALELWETKDNAAENSGGVGAWKPQHMILGHDTNLSRDEAVRRARKFLSGIGPERDYTVDPYAPWKFGQIVRVRCCEGYLQMVVFAARKKI